jgi:hypothetical protein
VCISHFPHACYTPCPLYSPWFDHPNIWWGVQIMKLQSPFTSSLLGPNIHLSILYTNTLNVCSPLRVTDHVSHSCKEKLKL